MKRNSVCFALLLLLTGCTVKETASAGWPEPVRFSSGESFVKTVISPSDDKYMVAWNSSDCVGIYASYEGDGANIPYFAEPTEENPSSCIFKPMTSGQAFPRKSDAVTYFSYFPFDSGAGNDPSQLSMSIPSQQTQSVADDMSHIGKKFFMYSVPAVDDAEEGVRFDFTGYPAVVELSLKMSGQYMPEIERVSISSATSPLALEGKFDITSGTPSLKVEKPSNTVVLGFDERPVLSGTARKVYMIVAPGSHPADDLSLRLDTENGAYSVMHLPPVTFRSNCSYRLPVELSLESFVFPTDFNVTAKTASVSAGEEVVFRFEGTPDVVDFWSGEPSHEWDKREGGGVVFADVSMSFRTHLQAGDQDPLSIKYSADYSGAGTEEAILAAKWTDISSRFIFATDKTDTVTPTDNTGFVSSGVQNVNDAFCDGKGPVYFAFFYDVADYSKTNLVRTTAYVNEFTINMTSEGVSTTLFTQSQTSFPFIVGKSYADNNDSTKPTWNKTLNSIKFTSTSKPIGERHAYAVTPEIYRTGKTIDADKPVTIKGESDVMPSMYKYVFNAPGNYKVVFVGRTNTPSGPKDVVREINIEVK